MSDNYTNRCHVCGVELDADLNSSLNIHKNYTLIHYGHLDSGYSNILSIPEKQDSEDFELSATIIFHANKIEAEEIKAFLKPFKFLGAQCENNGKHHMYYASKIYEEMGWQDDEKAVMLLPGFDDTSPSVLIEFCYAQSQQDALIKAVTKFSDCGQLEDYSEDHCVYVAPID